MKYLIILECCIALQTTSFAAGSSVKKISTGTSHSCALLDNGTIKCWGRNNSGQLGTEDGVNYGSFSESMGSALPIVNLGETSKAKDLCTGFAHSCAVFESGGVKCWGANDAGQLGQSGTNIGLSPGSMGKNLAEVPLGINVKVTALACGNNFTCGTTNDGRAKCWGDNQFGQLGVGSSSKSIGKNDAEMGSALPFVMLGAVAKIKSLNAGSGHACALFEDGRVKCWGSNGFGQLGYNDTTLRGTKPELLGDNLAYLDLGKNVVLNQISLGLYHTCATTTSGKIKCWGNNGDGNLGNGTTASRGNAPGSMGDSLPDVLLGSFTALAVYANGEHTCAIGTGGSVKCWGLNDMGQLGMGDQVTRGKSPDRMNENLHPVNLALPVKAIAEGKGYHTCALLINSQLKCWGKNISGQLGYNDDLSRGAGPQDMGELLPFIAVQ